MKPLAAGTMMNIKDFSRIKDYMETERCKQIVTAIQTLESTEIMELFKLLHKHKCEYTRNNNGIFINLSWLSEDILEKIEQYVAFCNKSHNEVQRYESICDVLNRKINDNKNKQTADADIPHSYQVLDTKRLSTVATNCQPGGRMSSSMKFYLLKKKFAKQVPLTTNAKNDLSRDAYVL
jgi:hypothetical protein